MRIQYRTQWWLNCYVLPLVIGNLWACGSAPGDVSTGPPQTEPRSAGHLATNDQVPPSCAYHVAVARFDGEIGVKIQETVADKLKSGHPGVCVTTPALVATPRVAPIMLTESDMGAVDGLLARFGADMLIWGESAIAHYCPKQLSS